MSFLIPRKEHAKASLDPTGTAFTSQIVKDIKKEFIPEAPPAAPPLPAVTPAPKATDPEVEKRKRIQQLAARLRSGRQQTIITGPQGVPSPGVLSTTLG